MDRRLSDWGTVIKMDVIEIIKRAWAIEVGGGFMGAYLAGKALDIGGGTIWSAVKDQQEETTGSLEIRLYNAIEKSVCMCFEYKTGTEVTAPICERLLGVWHEEGYIKEEKVERAFGPHREKLQKTGVRRWYQYLYQSLAEDPGLCHVLMLSNLQTEIAMQHEQNRLLAKIDKDKVALPADKRETGRQKPGGALYAGVIDTKIEDLYYLSQWIPFCGRAGERNRITEFCLQPDLFLWGVISGQGGSGKSRLYLEWRLGSLPPGWSAYVLEREFTQTDICAIANQRDTIIAVDYVAGREKQIAEFMKQIYGIFKPAHSRLRVILIERSNSTQYGSWLEQFFHAYITYHWKELIRKRWPSPKDSIVHLGCLKDNEIEKIIIAVLKKFSRQPEIHQVKLLCSLFKENFPKKWHQPLFLEIYLTKWARQKRITKLSLEELYDWLLDREQERWKAIINRTIDPAGEKELTEDILSSWKDLICFNAATGQALTMQNIDSMPRLIRENYERIFKLAAGKRKDSQYEAKLSRFAADMQGSECKGINITAAWPDPIVGYLFLKYANRSEEALRTFADACMKTDSNYFQSFVGKLEQDFPKNKFVRRLWSYCGLKKTPDQVFWKFNITKGSFPRALTSQEEQEYLSRYREGDKTARDILINSNLGLVYHICKKYATASELTEEERFSTGAYGLIKGIEASKTVPACRLVRCLTQAIENEIVASIRKQRNYQGHISPVSDLYRDTCPMISDKDTEQSAIQAYQLEEIKKILPCLNQRLREIIILRYGLQDGNELTSREICEKLNVSRACLSRLEKKALKELQGELEKSRKGKMIK